MNRDQAYATIRETFTQSFDKERYRNFVINLLNKIDETKAATWPNQYIKNAFKDHVSRYERLGTYTSPGKETIDVLTVYLTSETKLERARTAIRNFVADHLKTRDEKNAALVAFVSPTEKLWRFSYVKMEYAAVEKESGKIGVETRLTPARRCSYIVGENESCHTAQSRFVSLLQDTQTNPGLVDMETAFSVEAITKEFFNQYVILFEDIKKALEKLVAKNMAIRLEFKAKNISTVDFAKKLLGQIVFLYFLQKKGWLGVAKGQEWGSGPKDFLRSMSNGAYGAYENFFNDILEPLFYQTLATDRGHDAWCNQFKCRIPFLNGGLFEPLCNYDWRKSDILLPNKLFRNTKSVEEGITGTGVLDVFDRFNFTVNEAEPLEKEVAIDPEILGKVFENLIEENRRKGLGAYYTPREIVHYMCQASLISYLDAALNTEEKPVSPQKPKQKSMFGLPGPEQMPLKTTVYQERVSRDDIETYVHLGDQAAFYEAARISGTKGYVKILPKSIEKYAQLIDEKLRDIAVCDPAVGSGAFLVGMMTEIVRSRSALTPYFNDTNERTPYYFKRHAINKCLYGVDIDSGAIEIAKLRLWLSLVVDEEDVQRIKPLPNLDYKVVAGNSLIYVERDIFNDNLYIELEKLKSEYFDKTEAHAKNILKRKIEDVFNQITKGRDVFNFEIHFSEVFHKRRGFDVVIANPPYIDSEAMTKTDSELRKSIQATYSMTKGNWDIYIAFYEKGFNLLNNVGALSFITPDKWISKPFGDELRKRTIKNIACILRAGRKVFESVNVDAIVSVFSNILPSHLEIYDFVESQIKFKRIIEKKCLKPPFAYDWLFSNHVDILEKIESNSGSSLEEWGECENACATSDAYKLQEFIINEPINSDKQEYLRIINTGTIGKYVSKWGNREMVYLGSRFIRPAVLKTRFTNFFKNSYGQKALKPKIILKGLNLLDACLDNDGLVIPGKTTLMVSSNERQALKVLLAFINSPVAFFYLKEKYPAFSYNQGTTFTKEMINKLPIPDIQSNDQKKIVYLVDKIITIKKLKGDSSATELENEVNEHVYRLYGMSEKEIAIIENKTF